MIKTAPVQLGFYPLIFLSLQEKEKIDDSLPFLLQAADETQLSSRLFFFPSSSDRSTIVAHKSDQTRTRVRSQRRWDETAFNSLTSSELLKNKEKRVHLQARCPAGENKSMGAADESNPSSSQILQRRSAPATHYGSIPPKSQTRWRLRAPPCTSRDGSIKSRGTNPTSPELEKLGVSEVGASVMQNFGLCWIL